MYILGIETSCDETAASVVKDGKELICSVISSSKELHESTGGIVPEVAARKQVEYMVPVLDSALKKFREYLIENDTLKPIKNNSENLLEFARNNIDAVAVTYGPGLAGSLVVGIEAAKALAYAIKKPLIPVNHLIGHIYGNFVDNPNPIDFPAVCLVVSGGHTDLIYMKDHYEFDYIGGTLDDAAGEAFDKTARMLGVGMYLGGALLSKKAEECKKDIYANKLPRPIMDQDNYDFSFSGLKTAVKRFVEIEKNIDVPCLAREFENAVVDVLVKKSMKAVFDFNAKTLLLGGGVSANRVLRERLQNKCDEKNITLHVPPLKFCTDNAVYIASTAYYLQKKYGIERFNEIDYSKITPQPSLEIMDSFVF